MSSFEMKNIASAYHDLNGYKRLLYQLSIFLIEEKIIFHLQNIVEAKDKFLNKCDSGTLDLDKSPHMSSICTRIYLYCIG